MIDSVLHILAQQGLDSSASPLVFVVPGVIAFLGVALGVISTMRAGNQSAQGKFIDQLQTGFNNQAVQILALDARLTAAEGNERECQKQLEKTKDHLQETQMQLTKVEYELKMLRGNKS